MYITNVVLIESCILVCSQFRAGVSRLWFSVDIIELLLETIKTVSVDGLGKVHSDFADEYSSVQIENN